MSYVPPADDRPPGGQRGRAKPKLPLVLGALIGAFGPFAGFVPAVLGVDLRFGTALLSWLGVLVVAIVLLFFDDTRRWGAGMLIGFFGMLVIGAGACVALLVSYNSSYGA